MTPLDFGVMFSLGLLSSLHCVQMCGPIVLSYSVAIGESAKPGSRHSLLLHHLAYNAGRVLTYSALGGLAGLVGGTLGFLGKLAGVASGLALVSGILMIVVGIVMLGLFPASLLGSNLFRVPARLLGPLGGFLSSPDLKRRFLLGLTLGFLPCGLIYAALLKAMASGSALSGTLTMLAFGLGTAGALLAIGFLSSMIRGQVSRWGSQLAAASVVAMGLLLVWRGIMPAMLGMGGHMHGPH
ncbi:MAG TPA: sulfite exporter TauE/SafE family protein [Terriglobales bacterium]|nr:sulfite exporter TauE/SafE family protein [Terriglobales bacterium]